MKDPFLGALALVGVCLILYFIALVGYDFVKGFKRNT